MLIIDLNNELQRLLKDRTVSWYKDNLPEQMCINTVKHDPSNIHLGRGNLKWDWDNSYTDENGEIPMIIYATRWQWII